MAKTKKRFVCPKHGCQCEVVFVQGGGGQFHSCPVCYNAGDKFTVEGQDPFKAYGNVAEEFNQYGVPQLIQEFPTAHEVRKITLKQEYCDFLSSITPAEESDFRVLRKSIEMFVHPLGGKYRKLSIDEVRNDLFVFRRDGKLG